jgi:uncharacterized C2H2 Zn-finger protein
MRLKANRNETQNETEVFRCGKLWRRYKMQEIERDNQRDRQTFRGKSAFPGEMRWRKHGKETENGEQVFACGKCW